jgi:hypothetical protein
MFLLCDCKIGFIIYFIVYSSSETELYYQDQLGVSASICETVGKNRAGLPNFEDMLKPGE